MKALETANLLNKLRGLTHRVYLVQQEPAVQKVLTEASADVAAAVRSLGKAFLEIHVAWRGAGPATL